MSRAFCVGVVIAAGICCLTSGSKAGLTVSGDTYNLDFEGLEHGRIVNNQYQPLLGISVDNPNRSFDLGVAFDTNRSGTADPDLQFPWTGGNLAGQRLGNMLIIQENNNGIGDGIANRPDDEGNRPAGTITLTWSEDVASFGFDVADLESVSAERSEVRFYNGASLLLTVDFMDFVTNGSADYDPTVSFGDRTANRIAPIDVLGRTGFGADRIEIAVGGSSAYDNFTGELVPTPASLALLGLGGAGLIRRRRGN